MECPICYEDLLMGDDVRKGAEKGQSEAQNQVLHSTSCGHVFHASCLGPWIEKNDSCPTCRKKVLPGTLRDLFLAPNTTTKSKCSYCPRWKKGYKRLLKRFEALEIDFNQEKRVNELNVEKLTELEKERDELLKKLKEKDSVLKSVPLSTSDDSSAVGCSGSENSLIATSDNSESSNPGTNLDLNRAFLSDDIRTLTSPEPVPSSSLDQYKKKPGGKPNVIAHICFPSPPVTRSNAASSKALSQPLSSSVTVSRKSGHTVASNISNSGPGPSSSGSTSTRKLSFFLSPIKEVENDDSRTLFIPRRRRKTVQKLMPIQLQQNPPVRRSERLMVNRVNEGPRGRGRGNFASAL